MASRQPIMPILEAKKLDTATETKTVAGESATTKPSSETKIVDFLWYIKKTRLQRNNNH